MYGWCGAFLVASAVWSLRNFDFALTLPEVSSRAWEAFVLSGLAVSRVMLLLFVLRFCGVRWPRTERLLVAALPLVPVLLYAGGEPLMSALRTLFYVAFGVPMWASIVLLARAARAGRTQGAWLVLAALLASEVLAVHDWLIAVDWLPFGTQRWQDYAAAVLTTGLVGALARRYFAAFATARTLNRELEARVRLAGALANLRYRFTPRLEAAGLALRWEVAELPELDWVPGRVLQVLRILQEALTNIIRHSGAARATVSAGVEAGELVLAVRDEGGGPRAAPGSSAPPGRGMANMRHRAQQLGGRLEVRSDGSGTEVVVRVPLGQAVRPDSGFSLSP